MLLPVASVRPDRTQDVTALGLPKAAPASLPELVTELRAWITEPPASVDPDDPDYPPPATPQAPNPRPVSRFVADFDAQVLAPLRKDLDGIADPAAFTARLAGPHERLAEAQAVAAGYPEVVAWFEELQAVVAELARRADQLGGSRPRSRRRESRRPPRHRPPPRTRRPPARAPRCPPPSRPSPPCCRRCAPGWSARRPPTGTRPATRSGRSVPVRTWARGCWPRWTRGSATASIRRGGGRPPRPATAAASPPFPPSRCCAPSSPCGSPPPRSVRRRR
ncbi:hypothetical protein O1L55_21700 [Streptomyces albulus]|nr:hypothetical protein [Streptomyces noursei]